MINILYCNINKMPDDQITKHLQSLPAFMREEILRYRATSDQKLRLLARLMLRKSVELTSGKNLMHKWEKDSNKKPFINGWYPFNISHAGEMVVFAYGSGAIGIDIEKKERLNYEEMIEYLHPEEQAYINNSDNFQQAFYTIWVKKEAALKAIGIGIVNGLKEFSCIGERVSYNGINWYFHLLSIHPEYISYVCSLNRRDEVSEIEFTLS